MTPPLASFSDWTLALLPRLFLYPGGLWMLLALLALRLVTRDHQSPITHHPSRLPSLATAWAALSLLPLPGANPLPFPIDRLSLALVLVTSLLLDTPPEGEHARGMARHAHSLAATLAVLAPLAGERSLLAGGNMELTWWLSMLAVAAALTAGYSATYSKIQNPISKVDWTGATRWLAWWGLGVAPLWSLETQLPGVLWVSLVYAVALAAIGLLSATQYAIRGTRTAKRRNTQYSHVSRITLYASWGLAMSSLLAALVL